MASKQSSSPAVEPQTIMTGLMFGESPRWHDHRLWLADWGSHEVLAISSAGRREVVASLKFRSFQPICIDWLPDGRLLIVSSRDGVLLRQERDGSMSTYADLSGIFRFGWNEIVVDGRGNTYVNCTGFDLMAGERFAPGMIALVTPDGAVRRVADDIAFPNGMAVTPDNSTLIVAESYAKKLTGFDIAVDGGLSNRRVWADLGDGVPDGICLDAEGAVWHADVPNKRCVRVREGGKVLQTIDLDRGCFGCMLGGAAGGTLFLVAQEWRGLEGTGDKSRTGKVLTVRVSAGHVGWP